MRSKMETSRSPTLSRTGALLGMTKVAKWGSDHAPHMELSRKDWTRTPRVNNAAFWWNGARRCWACRGQRTCLHLRDGDPLGWRSQQFLLS